MIESGRNELMFPLAENLHNNIDNSDLTNIKTYNIVGCGTPTIGNFEIINQLYIDPYDASISVTRIPF